MRDNLPQSGANNKHSSMIINTDKQNGAGIHWVGLYEDKDGIEYFDPFGMSPLPEVEKYMRKLGKPMYYNSQQLQNIMSDLCGWYVMYYIIERNKGRSAYDVIMDFTQHPSGDNEKMIDSFGRSIEKVHGGKLGDFLNKFALNEIITNLPFEAHLYDRGDDGKIQKMNFAGPGTRFNDRVKLDDYGNIKKIITPPINKLDLGAMEHDRIYTLYGDVDNRNIADKKLKKVADIVYRESTDKIQRANALLVSLIMKTKIKYNI